MTTKSLFNIILKVMGVYLLMQGLLTLPYLISTFQMILTDRASQSLFISILIIAGTVIMYFLIARELTLYSERITNRIFKKDEEPELLSSFKIHRSTVLSISILVIGGISLINDLPGFLVQLYNYFSEKSYFNRVPFPSNLVIAGVKVLLSVCLLTFQKNIVIYIERKRIRENISSS